MVIKDIEIEEVDFIAKTINAVPIPHIKQFTRDKLGNANLVEERKLDGERKVIYVTGCSVQSKTVSNLVRGSN
jgi:T-complex protein 1 subunit delta